MSGSDDDDKVRGPTVEVHDSRGLQVGDHNIQVNVDVTVPGQRTAGPRPQAAGPAVTVTIEAALADDGMLDSRVLAGDSVLCERQAPLPPEVASIWSAQRMPALVAGERMADAGRRLAGALLDGNGQRALGELLRQVPPGELAEVVLVADGPALSLPVELTRLACDQAEVGPLALLPNVSVSRRDAGTPASAPPRPTPGPLKILAAVAAPDEAETRNVPLDVEAEMAAMLDAVSGVVGDSRAQVRILEVASLKAIRNALENDAYHVLHLSAHGSPDLIELEDEDGSPARVTPKALMLALKHGGREVPLIVLSACPDRAAGSDAMAAGLIAHGADRVVAMPAPVTDPCAITLARHFYHQLAVHPEAPVGHALARARFETEETRAKQSRDHVPPAEYGVAMLLASHGDAGLIDPQADPAPLTFATTPPSGKGVRELTLGSLIGRRPQLRDVMGILRRTDLAVDQHGAMNGVVLTGVGGIGKTAIAGRAVSRLRDEGWLIAVHEGRWNPTALINATAEAIADVPDLHAYRDVLTWRDADDVPKLELVAGMLARHRLLIVFDDFEQNLTQGGDAFLDPQAEDAITQLGSAADPGALLITCRYPLPGQDGLLATVPVPPLSPSELRRMFLRLPALRDLDGESERLLIRTIGGYPRLIEFTDALLRAGRSNFTHVQRKLRALASREGISLTGASSLEKAVSQAMLLGSADILLRELVALLTPRQADVLRQVAVCYGAMSLDDLAFALGGDGEPASASLGRLRPDIERLIDLTLLAPGLGIEMHPWTASLVTRTATGDTARLHEQALAMRYRRREQDRAAYDDLIDIPRHLAALARYDAVADDVYDTTTRVLSGTLATRAYLAEMLQLIPPTEQAWSVISDLMGDVLLLAGDLPGARASYQANLIVAQRLAATDPANAQWQRDQAVSHNKIGNVAAAQGDLTAARASYQASLTIIQRLAATDPANTEWQRDLSVSHNKIGDTAAAQGDLPAARASYQASLRIRRNLAATDPHNTQWQHDLSVSHERIGDVATDQGDLPAARASYQACLCIRQRLAATDPANAEWQRDLSVSHNKIGDVARAEGDIATARAAHQASLDIITRLAELDPSNALWQDDVAFTRRRLNRLPPDGEA